MQGMAVLQIKVKPNARVSTLAQLDDGNSPSTQ
jgi:hypothetical protein